MSSLEKWRDIVYSAITTLHQIRNNFYDSEVLLLANSIAHNHVRYDPKSRILTTPINGLNIQEPLRFMRQIPHVKWRDLGLRITAKQLILNIIQQHPIAGLFDSPLILLTWANIGGLELLNVEDGIMRLYTFKVIPERCYYPENITRIRRFIIAEHPELVEQIRQDERYDKAEWFREKIKQVL